MATQQSKSGSNGMLTSAISSNGVAVGAAALVGATAGALAAVALTNEDTRKKINGFLHKVMKEGENMKESVGQAVGSNREIMDMGLKTLRRTAEGMMDERSNRGSRANTRQSRSRSKTSSKKS